MKSATIESKTIDFLRFSLIVGVVLIHARFTDVWTSNGVVGVAAFPVAASVMKFISGDICALCVPMFFFISGYLFFCGCDFFTVDVYRSKLLKRARSLLVPYLFWNAVVIAVYFLAQTIFPSMVSGNNKPIVDYTPADFMWAFWNLDVVNGVEDLASPIAFQFWYIRDLMVLCMLSPVIYFCVKRFGVWALLVFEILSQLQLLPEVVGLSTGAVFFFSAGAYFCIHKRSFVLRSRTWCVSVAAVYLVTLFLPYVYDLGTMRGCVGLLNIMSGMAMLFTVAAVLIERKRVKSVVFLKDSAFMIFAVHALLLQILQRVALRLTGTPDDAMLIILYFVITVIAVGVSMLLYGVLRRFLPRFTAVITGGR